MEERGVDEREREWRGKDRVASRDIRQRDSSSLGDERRKRQGEDAPRVESRKANLTFISGILGFAPKRTLSREGSRARDRVEYEEGGRVALESVHKLLRILHPAVRNPSLPSLLCPLNSLWFMLFDVTKFRR